MSLIDDLVQAWRLRLWSLRTRWAFRRSLPTEGTMAVPVPQVHEDDGEEAFRRKHGYAKARLPMAQTEEQQAHNSAIDVEYAEEIEHRKALMLAGEYTPRFYVPPESEWVGFIPSPAFLADPENVNWHLEISMLPGRRLDVTKDVGVPMQPVFTPDGIAEHRAVALMTRALDGMEAGKKIATVRDMVGTRADILRAVHGNEAMADAVEQKAREAFGVTDLDAPVPAFDGR